MNKLTRGLSRSLKGSKGVKYRIVLNVQEVTGLPDFASKAQVIWNRGQKVERTDVVDIKNGTAEFNQSLSFISTMFQSKKSMDSKHFNIRVQLYNESYEGSFVTNLREQEIDMSKYVGGDQSDIPLDIKFSHHGYTIKIATTVSSQFARQNSDDLSSATTANTQSTDVIPATIQGAPNFYADAPVQVQEAVSEENIEQPALPEEPIESQLSAVIQGPAGLYSAIDSASQTTAFQQQIKSLNLEETGRKIGKGMAEVAFGERVPSATEGLYATAIKGDVTTAAVEQNLQNSPVKPLIEPLLKGMMTPIEDTIHINLDVNICQAFVKVLFPWAACAKK